ncbi:MAG TPA: class I SAM-dependent methyltransferase [Candidatus Saccharimonadales bacterium]|nr:class I SAM-dependent methyltransferase [Candidatus Saccharimonadales bacterium]
MDWNTQTIKTYDSSAQALAKYFKGIGARVDDIELGLKLAGADNTARAVEIGCGDGRDAIEIVKRVGWYEGFDPSKGLLEIAEKNLPSTSFVVADALTYHYPQNVDVIFAFASLLHANKTDLPKVFEKAAQSLRSGGVFYISLKERETYTEEAKKDEYGERMFYYYNIDLIRELAGSSFTTVHEAHQKIGKTDWFTIALKRK